MDITELKKEILYSKIRIQDFIREESLRLTTKTNTKIQDINIVLSPLSQLGTINPIDYIVHVSITPDLGL